MDETLRRAAIVAEARRWIGTPYAHAASRRGAGCDCLGLIRGIWRALIGPEPETPPPYAPDWSEAEGLERLLDAARRRLDEIRVADARPGDVVLMRMRERGPAKHVGVLAASPGGAETLIHAYSGRGVVESPLARPWRRRIVAAFALPEGDR